MNKTNRTKMITGVLAFLAVISMAAGLAPYNPAQTEETAVILTETIPETQAVTSAAEETAPPEPTETSTYLFRGHWLDCNGVIIWYSKGNSRVAAEKYDECFANLISDASEVKLDQVAAEPYLRNDNPTLLYADDGYHLIGQSLQMTVDADKQLAAYELLRQYGIKGSITVLNTDGGVACAASYPSFSHDSYITDQTGTKTEVDCFNHQSFVNAASGSVFKIASGTLAAKYGILKMQDLGFCPTYEYSNWDYEDQPARYPCERTLQQALLNSSNYWFGQVFYELGAERVTADLNEYFAFNEIHSDFGTLTQYMPLASNADLVRAGFGQRMAASPLYLAAVGNAVVTGEMCRPHFFSHTVDSVTMTALESVWRETVLCTVPTEYTAPILEGMELVTADLGLYAGEGKTLYTKTGTAEINTEMYTDFLYLLCVVRDNTSGETKSILLQIQNPQELGYEYARNAAPVMQEILQIFN